MQQLAISCSHSVLTLLALLYTWQRNVWPPRFVSALVTFKSPIHSFFWNGFFVEIGMNEMFIRWWIYSVEFDCCDNGDDSDCKVQPGDFLPQVVRVAWVELDGKPEPYPREPWGRKMWNCNIFYCYLDFLVELLSVIWPYVWVELFPFFSGFSTSVAVQGKGRSYDGVSCDQKMPTATIWVVMFFSSGVAEMVHCTDRL